MYGRVSVHIDCLFCDQYEKRALLGAAREFILITIPIFFFKLNKISDVIYVKECSRQVSVSVK